MLINTDAYFAGRVVGSDGHPIVGAEVFNRGDAPGPVAKATDSQGRFRLEGMLPGTRFVFVRKEGYRFTGVKNQGNTDGMTITLLKTTEPPPAWKPVTTASREEERAFAKAGPDPHLAEVRFECGQQRRVLLHPGHGRDRSGPRHAVVGREGPSVRR